MICKLLLIYLLSGIISKYYWYRDLSDDEGVNMIFALKVLSSWMSLIPIMNTYFALSGIYHDIKDYVVFHYLMRRLNKMAKRYGYKDFFEMGKDAETNKSIDNQPKK